VRVMAGNAPACAIRSLSPKSRSPSCYWWEPVERAVPAPAGGVRVRLGNRFRSAVVGVRTEDGEVAVACGGDEQAGRGELQPGVAGEEELP
jgi:hypothetical protein